MYAQAGYPAHAGNAHRLSKNEKVAARILEIQNQTVQRTVTTIEDMIAQIDEDRRFARERGHSSAALSASMAKAKLMGFLDDSPAPENNFNYASMTEEEVLFEIAAIHQNFRQIKASKGRSNSEIRNSELKYETVPAIQNQEAIRNWP